MDVSGRQKHVFKRQLLSFPRLFYNYVVVERTHPNFLPSAFSGSFSRARDNADVKAKGLQTNWCNRLQISEVSRNSLEVFPDLA